MASLYVTEFRHLARDGQGTGIAAPFLSHDGAVAKQVVPITGVSVESTPFNDSTKFIMLTTDATCCVDIGSTPNAVAQFPDRITPGERVFYGVHSGDMIAAIASS